MTTEMKDGSARNAAKVIASVGAQGNVVVPNSKYDLLGGSAENALNIAAEATSSGLIPTTYLNLQPTKCSSGYARAARDP